VETEILGLPAPPLENVRWIDENDDARSQLNLAELGHGFKILYFFQDWCPGCHKHDFPTFRTLAEGFRDKEVGLAAIQTVFEGAEVSTFDRIAVGTSVAGRPPHRSRRAEFPHRAPTSDA
jgi:thiol-disulfide isomerase/thioredoxin